MYHDASLAARTGAAADPRPASAVSTGVGIAGLVGMSLWVAIALSFGMDGPYAALVNVAACGVPMVLWSLLVDKVHRNPSTGIDWSTPRAWAETREISIAKLVGLWLTWTAIAGVYAAGRFYWQGNFAFAMEAFITVAPLLFVASVPWIFWSDRYLVEPRDGAWALGAWLMKLDEPVDREAIWNFLRSWVVKGFFLAFMLAIVPAGFGDFIRADRSQLFHDPVALAQWLITFMFVIDVAFATVGYILTFRALDAHIRTANPLAKAWTAALICYPPFVLMGQGGPLDYHVANHGDGGWPIWFGGHPLILSAVGATLVVLTGIYAWATVAFGLRFSNLTHRGILTHGPYAFSRHPAYLSKNLFWWIATIPILTTTGSWADAARNTALMAVVSGVYYWRARTEEEHLGADPAYQAYTQWMARNGLVPRLFAKLLGTKP